jgi:hypothetical protein
MRNDMTVLLESNLDGLSQCDACPFRGGCAFATDRYVPSYCLHEYKLLHAFVASQLRQRPPGDARGYAGLSEDVRRYAKYLHEQRPFDPTRVSNVAPVGPSVPVDAGRPQTNLLAFGAP